MKLLVIGLDSRLALTGAPSNESQERQLVYAGKMDKMTIVCKTPNATEYAKRELSARLTVYPTRSSNRWTFLKDAYWLGKKLLRQGEYDLISTQDPFYSGLVGYLLARSFKIPLNLQLHSDFVDNPYWISESWSNYWLNILGKYLIKRAASVRVVNQSVRQELIERGLAAERIFVCPIGTVTENFCDASGSQVRQLYLNEDYDYLVLSVGRLVPAKDYPTLLQTARLVKAVNPKVRFLILGEGRERERLRRLIGAMGLEQQVILAGAIDFEELPQYYAACDVFLLTSIFEGLSRVLVEAAAAAKPLVATAVAAAEEFIEPEENGIIAPIGDFEQLAQGLLRLLEQPLLRETMGAKARLKAKEYHFEKTAARLVAGWRGTRPG